MKLGGLLSRALFSAGLLAAAVTPGCGDPDALLFPTVQDEELLVQMFDEAWATLQAAPRTVPYSGIRRVSFRTLGPEGTFIDVAYREQVWSDGNGQFHIQPLDAEGPVFPDEATFLLMQARREGFFFRYRDFEVRDADLLVQNYELFGGVHAEQFVGRSGMRAQLLRKLGGGRHYEVVFDIETGLPLRYVEFGDDAEPLASLEYESLDLDPDLSNVPWHLPSNVEETLDLADGSAFAVLGFEPVLPQEVPEGFELHEAAKVEDHQSGRWLKLGYTDGAEMLFFLSRPRPAPVSLPTTPRSRKSVQPQDVVKVFGAGPVTVLQGAVGQHEFIVAGEVDQDLLLQMIDSAID